MTCKYKPIWYTMIGKFVKRVLSLRVPLSLDEAILIHIL
jgi:hypothetical protein